MSLSKSDTLKSVSSLALAFGWIVMLKLNVIEMYWSEINDYINLKVKFPRRMTIFCHHF